MKALITTDGSLLSLTVLDTARQVTALVPDVELHLVKVLDARRLRGALDESEDTDGESLERIRQDEEAALISLSKSQLGGTAVHCHVRWSDAPAKAITDLAAQIGADVILMATHGRSGISQLLAGSVTEAVIRTSGRPVLVSCPTAQWTAPGAESGAAARREP